MNLEKHTIITARVTAVHRERYQLVCEYGEIFGKLEENKFVYRKFNKNLVNNKYTCDDDTHIDTLIDVTISDDRENNASAGHSGGDFFIMKDLCSFLRGEGTSVSTTVIEDSVNSHLICYAAEKSRIEKTVVDIEKEYKR